MKQKLKVPKERNPFLSHLKIDADEHMLLTEEEIERIKEICANPPKPTEYMLGAVERYKERYGNETKD